MADLIPKDFWNFPRLRFPSLWDDLREDLEEMRTGMMIAPRGMSIYEDDKNVFAESKKEEGEEKRKYYYKSRRSYSYQVMVPSSVDTSKDPDVSYRNGLLVAKFDKSPTKQPKKIPIKTVGGR